MNDATEHHDRVALAWLDQIAQERSDLLRAAAVHIAAAAPTENSARLTRTLIDIAADLPRAVAQYDLHPSAEILAVLAGSTALGTSLTGSPASWFASTLLSTPGTISLAVRHIGPLPPSDRAQALVNRLNPVIEEARCGRLGEAAAHLVVEASVLTLLASQE